MTNKVSGKATPCKGKKCLKNCDDCLTKHITKELTEKRKKAVLKAKINAKLPIPQIQQKTDPFFWARQLPQQQIFKQPTRHDLAFTLQDIENQIENAFKRREKSEKQSEQIIRVIHEGLNTHTDRGRFGNVVSDNELPLKEKPKSVSISTSTEPSFKDILSRSIGTSYETEPLSENDMMGQEDSKKLAHRTDIEGSFDEESVSDEEESGGLAPHADMGGRFGNVVSDKEILEDIEFINDDLLQKNDPQLDEDIAQLEGDVEESEDFAHTDIEGRFGNVVSDNDELFKQESIGSHTLVPTKEDLLRITNDDVGIETFRDAISNYEEPTYSPPLTGISYIEDEPVEPSYEPFEESEDDSKPFVPQGMHPLLKSFGEPAQMPNLGKLQLKNTIETPRREEVLETVEAITGEKLEKNKARPDKIRPDISFFGAEESESFSPKSEPKVKGYTLENPVGMGGVTPTETLEKVKTESKKERKRRTKLEMKEAEEFGKEDIRTSERNDGSIPFQPTLERHFPIMQNINPPLVEKSDLPKAHFIYVHPKSKR